MKNVQVIDLVRSAAVSAVLAHHLGLLQAGQPSPTYFLRWIWYKCWVNGSYGVPLFFVVSGFLITGLIAAHPRGLFNPDFRWFYARRIGRILPLLVLICAIGICFLFFDPSPLFPIKNFYKSTDEPFKPGFWISITTFWFNWYRIPMTHSPGYHWNLLWSLSVEEQFYFFYPFALKRLKNGKNLTVFLAAFIVLGAASQWVGYTYFRRGNNIQYNSFSGFGLIAMGCLLYILSERFKGYLKSHKRQCLYFCLAGLALVLKIYFHQPYLADYWGNILDYTWLGVGLCLFLLGSFHLDFFKSKYWWFLSLNGKMSYGIYLLQATVICLLYPLLVRMNEYLSSVVAFLSVLLVALVSYYYYELPSNYFLRKIIAKKPVSP